MEHTDTELKKGERIWLQTYGVLDSPFRLQMAEVITVMQIPVGAELKHHVIVRYWTKEI